MFRYLEATRTNVLVVFFSDLLRTKDFPAHSLVRAIMTSNPALIDQFLPVFNFSERHSIDIHASAEEVFSVVRSLNFTPSFSTRILFRLRGLPSVSASLTGLQKMGFVFLGERAPVEMALGIVGKFWTLSGCIQSLTADLFGSFQTPGYAKAAWNFTLSEPGSGSTTVATETRILCMDESSRLRFRLYWFFVRPFSGLIRRSIPNSIKQHVENRRMKG